MIPRSRWSGKGIAIPFTEIVEWREHHDLTIVYNRGKFNLNASMLPRKKILMTSAQQSIEA